MAVDEMEISYEGQGDDDIDINIDIEPGNHDEDFILEDARSEAGTNDDVMLDEDNASYNMEDADYVPEEDVQDVIDTETVDVSELEMSMPHETNINTFISEAITSPLPNEDHFTAVNVDTEDSKQTAKIEQLRSDIVTEPASQRTPPPETNLVREKISSPLTNGKPEEVKEINEQSPSHVHEDQEQGETSDTEEQEQIASSQRNLVSEERNVIVGYQESEYSLVASSESDDPDSYFLKDSSVLKEPLSALFVALRDILNDEIPVGEELMCTIDDLGLEICETSTSNIDLTFSQIMDLHTTFVRNDGEGVMPPLYVTLLTRPEFGRVFANLVEDAQRGKGLHELTKTWNDDDILDVWAGSEEFDGETSPHVNGTDADESEQVENAEFGNDDQTEVDSVQKVPEEKPSLEAPKDGNRSVTSAADELDAPEVTDEADKNNVSNEPNEPIEQWDDKSEAESTKGVENGDREIDEGDDFIDYEDEVYAEAGNGAHNNLPEETTNRSKSGDHEAPKESLNISRRSSSHTIDVINDTEATTQSEIVAPEDVNELAELTVDLAADINGNTDKEGELSKNFENVVDEPEHQPSPHNEEEVQYEEEEGEEVNASYNVEIEDSHSQEPDDEVNQGEEFGHKNTDIETATFDNYINGDAENDGGGEISYEDDDEESLLSLAGNREVGDETAATSADHNHQEEKDEIDYEDDEDESPLGISEPTTPSKPTIPGKRPHEEDGDAIGISSQEAKRSRS